MRKVLRELASKLIEFIRDPAAVLIQVFAIKVIHSFLTNGSIKAKESDYRKAIHLKNTRGTDLGKTYHPSRSKVNRLRSSRRLNRKVKYLKTNNSYRREQLIITA